MADRPLSEMEAEARAKAANLQGPLDKTKEMARETEIQRGINTPKDLADLQGAAAALDPHRRTTKDSRDAAIAEGIGSAHTEKNR